MANHFIWHELNSTDRDAAAEFHRAVVGWDTKPYESGATIASSRWAGATARD